ncbi:MAG: tRNA dihydrouridine synthase DusB [Brevefilum sp.]|nr:tRNA dihydrouridine synthase DusB [Brevefilum sp.]MDT8380628.1 tRNA dihydrouridine synthase DusB [Brevefilum sp.]
MNQKSNRDLITEKTPYFMIGDVPIYGDLILAPMDGVTDMPFRSLCRRLGSALTVTEFINAIDVIENHPRYHKRLAFEPDQRPLSLQILGNQPERMLTATMRLVNKIHPDIIDINIGCQSKNVTARGAGAALMKSPKTIARIFQLMTHTFKLPITGKIRLGWDHDHLNYLEIARIIEDNGGAMVAVHGRTRQQAYRGQAQWDPIFEVKQDLRIPVIGNGDVKTIADIQKIKESTGCDAVMIGRAAVSNPWIFSRLDREDVPVEIVKETILNHLDAMLDFYGERGVITFRKFLKAYLRPYDLQSELLLSLLKSKDPEFIKSNLEEIFVKE